MSCRKFEAPRHGSLAFMPKKRAKKIKQSIRGTEKDDPSVPVHLTAFYAYKAGMTHVIRNKVISVKKTSVNKDQFDAVTILETPPMIIFGLVGYIHTNSGLKNEITAYSSHVNDSVLRRFYKKFHLSKRKMYISLKNKCGEKINVGDIAKLKKCDVIKVLTHTQVEKIKNINTKKAHIAEIQVNGGSVSDKVEWAVNMLEKEIQIGDVFNVNEMLDTVGVTKGHGFTGVTKRFGTRILNRKSNRGRRKISCIGAWHPANVLRTVPRAGQFGCHRRTEFNKLVYRIGNGKEEVRTEFDLTTKGINPMGGFIHYGYVNNDFIMLKGSVLGCRKRVIALRKTLSNKNKNEQVQIKFIDTSSKMGAGRFQTSEEKAAFYGIKKKKAVVEEN